MTSLHSSCAVSPSWVGLNEIDFRQSTANACFTDYVTPPSSGSPCQPPCVCQRERPDKGPTRRVNCDLNLDRSVLSVNPGFGYSYDLSNSHLRPAAHHLQSCVPTMSMFIVTASRHDKPLPALPYNEGRRRPSSLVLPNSSSAYSHASSARAKSQLRYDIESEGSSSSQESSNSPRSSISVPSILKPSRASNNSVTYRRTERRSTCAYTQLVFELHSDLPLRRSISTHYRRLAPL